MELDLEQGQPYETQANEQSTVASKSTQQVPDHETQLLDHAMGEGQYDAERKKFFEYLVSSQPDDPPPRLLTISHLLINQDIDQQTITHNMDHQTADFRQLQGLTRHGTEAEFKGALYRNRNILCDVYDCLRGEIDCTNNYYDTEKLEKNYLASARDILGPPTDKLEAQQITFQIDSLVGQFMDVSWIAQNRQSVPEALDLSAEDCNEARRMVHEGDKWFEMDTKTVSGKKVKMVANFYISRNPHKVDPNKLLRQADTYCYLEWKPLEKVGALSVEDQGQVKRLWWSPQRKLLDYDDVNKRYVQPEVQDERVTKCFPHMTRGHMVILAEMLLSSAVSFNFLSMPALYLQDRPDRKIPLVKSIMDNAAGWFRMFAVLPYDATFSLEKLLDCTVHIMQLMHMEEIWMVKSVATGLFLANRPARLMWTQTIETLLYNFNIHAKFLVPRRQALPLQILPWFSTQRASLDISKQVYGCEFRDLVTEKLKSKWWLLYFRLLSSAQIAKTQAQDKSDLMEFYLLADKIRNQGANQVLEARNTIVDPNMPSSQFVLLCTKTSSKRQGLIPIAESMLMASPPFAILTRYYVLSLITGAHHLFVFGSKHVENDDIWFQQLHYQPKFIRSDIRAYLRWYFDFAHSSCGLPLPNYGSLMPFDMLKVMHVFWYKNFGVQESVVVCLEMQQRHLFIELKRMFNDDYREAFSDQYVRNVKHPDMQPRFIYLQKTVIRNLHYKAGFDRDRLFFLDILARRMLLHCCLAQLKQEFQAYPYLPPPKQTFLDQWPLGVNKMGHIRDVDDETFIDWNAFQQKHPTQQVSFASFYEQYCEYDIDMKDSFLALTQESRKETFADRLEHRLNQLQPDPTLTLTLSTEQLQQMELLDDKKKLNRLGDQIQAARKLLGALMLEQQEHIDKMKLATPNRESVLQYAASLLTEQKSYVLGAANQITANSHQEDVVMQEEKKEETFLELTAVAPKATELMEQSMQIETMTYDQQFEPLEETPKAGKNELKFIKREMTGETMDEVRIDNIDQCLEYCLTEATLLDLQQMKDFHKQEFSGWRMNVFLQRILRLIGMENRSRHLDYARDAIAWFKQQNYVGEEQEYQDKQFKILSLCPPHGTEDNI